jgi:hypothetical protein
MWFETTSDAEGRLAGLSIEITRVKYRTGSLTDKATWRNGSAFGFDRRRHQKVAGSSPAVVIFFPPSGCVVVGPSTSISLSRDNNTILARDDMKGTRGRFATHTTTI